MITQTRWAINMYKKQCYFWNLFISEAISCFSRVYIQFCVEKEVCVLCLDSASLLGQKMSWLMTKPTKWRVHPAKTQISLGVRPVWSESSLCAQWVAKDPSFLRADSKGSDQIGRMPKLTWVFDGYIGHFVGFAMMRLKWKLDFSYLMPFFY